MVSDEQPLTREQVREVDRIAIEEFGLPGIVLMENAGRNCAELLLRQEPTGPIVICCGKGNNGGDGFVIARHLVNRGVDVRVLLFADEAKVGGDAATNLTVVRKMELDLQVFADDIATDQVATALQGAEWIVDALLGTGITGDLRDPFPAIHRAINDFPAKVFAVDLPSGLDCDTGEPLGEAVRADVTATFVATKVGFTKEFAREYVGIVEVIDIGVPREIVDRILSET